MNTIPRTTWGLIAALILCCLLFSVAHWRIHTSAVLPPTASLTPDSGDTPTEVLHTVLAKADALEEQTATLTRQQAQLTQQVKRLQTRKQSNNNQGMITHSHTPASSLGTPITTVPDSQPVFSAPSPTAQVRYHIPANATLSHAVLMTNLVGEVPVGGHLMMPALPFKAVLNATDLIAANGIALPPQLKGLVLSGYAVGHAPLHCVRAYVTQTLFVFEDGHFAVYPHHTPPATAVYPDKALGYLSDEVGNTCLPGTLIHYTPTILARLAALEGIAASLTHVTPPNKQVTVDKNQVTTTQTVSGHFAQDILGWYRQRVADTSDMVWLSASNKDKPRRLVWHVTQTFPITWDPTWRLTHDEKTTAFALD